MMRQASAWPFAVGAVAVLTFAGGSMSLQQREVPHNGISSMRARVGPVKPGEPIRVAMLFQLSDCSSNLRPLSLLWEPHVADRITLFELWYVGPAKDSTAIRALLPARALGTPLRPAPQGIVAELRRLGHQHTPVLVAYDQEGRVRFTSQSPRSAREFAGLRKIIEGLTWIEEL